MPQISFVTRSFVVSRLLDANTGFNYWAGQAAPDYKLDPFTLAQGDRPNLFIGAFAPDDLEASGYDPIWPLAIVYSRRALNPSIVTPSEFAGPVITVVDFWTGFLQDEPPLDGESIADLIEDAMYETFNREDYYGLEQQFSDNLTSAQMSAAGGLTYNNELDTERGPLKWGGQNWRQLLRFTITHRRITNGR